MTVIKDFALDFEPLRTLERMGRDQALLGEALSRKAYAAALDEARNLVQPTIAYAIHPVAGVEEGRLLIAEGAALESPVVASLFGSAPEVALLAYTIGPMLEVRVQQLKDGGEHAASRVLDIIGSLALHEVGQVAYRHVEELARAKGMKASIPLNPGTSHWPSSGQQIFLKLCPLAEIGIQLTASNFLVPFKSITMAIALGTDVLTPDRGSSCDYCATRELCRKDRLAGAF